MSAPPGIGDQVTVIRGYKADGTEITEDGIVIAVFDDPMPYSVCIDGVVWPLPAEAVRPKP